MNISSLHKATEHKAITVAGVKSKAQSFRDAMRRLAGGVSVITACQDTQRTGLTATSVISVSLDPAELLISVNRNASAYPLIQQTKRFGVNVLSAPLRNVAERFSGKDGVHGEQRYQEALWERDEYGVWLLPEALVTFSCKVEKSWEHRSHMLIVGKVEGIHFCGTAKEPLTYWQGEYGGFTTLSHVAI